MAEKIYCGTGKMVTTKFGDIPKMSFHKDNINSMVKYMKDNELDWINVEMKQKREVQEGKPTHYLEVDTWKPSERTTEQQSPVAPASDDVPF
jgi:hypothetical protein